MNTTQLYAWYRRTAPLEDVRFFQRARMPRTLRADLEALEADVRDGLKRSAVYSRYACLQDRWRRWRNGAADPQDVNQLDERKVS